ncbi:MAG: hypothetical protein OEZ07_04880, partial [Dehalococcoidia bacterium]|nr:hypothetical protein [Dehalococcoidia bacterium]
PSRFLQDIPSHLVTTRGLWEQESLGLPATVYSQSPVNSLSTLELKVGDWVHHSKFGDGVVLDCLPDRGDRVVTVAFKEAGVKKLLLSLAKLEKVEKDIDFP